MAHNLVRAAGALASLPFAKARAATIRRDPIAVAARTARRSGLTAPAAPTPSPSQEPRTSRTAGLERVFGGSGGGVGPAGWCAPGQDARFGLVEPPAFGLLAPVMVSAQGSVATYAGIVGHSRAHF